MVISASLLQIIQELILENLRKKKLSELTTMRSLHPETPPSNHMYKIINESRFARNFYQIKLHETIIHYKHKLSFRSTSIPNNRPL